MLPGGSSERPLLLPISFLEPRSGSLKVPGVLLIDSSTNGGRLSVRLPVQKVRRERTRRPITVTTRRLVNERSLSPYLRISWLATL